MLSLAAFGAPVERTLGPRRFVLFYLSAGIVAGLVHVLIYSDSADPVVGASGAISGVFGAVLILLRSGGGITSLLPVAGIWIALNVFFGVSAARRVRAASRSPGPRTSRAFILRSGGDPLFRAAPAGTEAGEWRSVAGCAIAQTVFGGA